MARNIENAVKKDRKSESLYEGILRMRERIKWIDIAKGICILSVVLGHMGEKQINLFVFAYHLTVFFLLSGYTLKEEKISREYLTKKFCRLMTPYFVTCFCIMGMDVINKILVSGVYSTEEITQMLRFDLARSFFASGSRTDFAGINIGGRIGAVWFFPAMFFALIFSQLILNHVKSWSRRFLLALGLAFAGMITAPFLWLPFSIQSAMAAVPFVLLGLFIKEYAILERLTWKHYLLFAGVFLAGYFSGYTRLYFVNVTMQDCFLTPMVSVCASLLIIGISRRIGHMRFLEFMGKNSLICLCVHLFELETMYEHFNQIRIWLHGEDSWFVLFVIKICFICITVLGINMLKKWTGPKMPSADEQNVIRHARDASIDLFRAFLVILMIAGHRQIDSGLRAVIYSFHMAAFVWISGYFYRPVTPGNFHGRVGKLIKSMLIPYGLFAVLYILMTHKGWRTECKTIVLGMSFADKLFPKAASVGPVYFILMLFCTKLIYLWIDRTIHREEMKTAAVLILCLAGAALGKEGLWLPWSLDCALFSVMFYHIGRCFQKFDLLKYFRERPFCYFILSPIWAYMIYKGSMELAVRRYNQLGLTVIGAVAGIVLLYLFCDFLNKRLTKLVGTCLRYVGQSTLYILIVHTLFRAEIYNFLDKSIHLNPENVYHFTAGIIVQVLMGAAVFFLAECCKNIRKKKPK